MPGPGRQLFGQSQDGQIIFRQTHGKLLDRSEVVDGDFALRHWQPELFTEKAV